MKLAAISDTHFGDDTSRLATTAGLNMTVFGNLAAAAGQNDYLILLGDIFDFSISDYSKTYAVAAKFFEAVRKARIAKEIIYIPGNHDFSFWNLVMHQANVINRVVLGKEPIRRPTVPAVLDARANADREVTLVGVEPKTVRNAGEPKYGDLFLDYLSGAGKDEQLTFNVAFPNLYLIEPSGETTLFTHGHYFDPYWAITMSIAREILKENLRLDGGTDPDIDDVVTVNFPLNELASSGLGQAGPLTDCIRAIQADAKAGQLAKIETYAQRARDMADRSITFGGILGGLKEILSDKCLDGAKDAVMKAAKDAKDNTGARDNAAWLRIPEIHDNVVAYLRSCILEAHEIEGRKDDAGWTGGPIPAVTKLVFGHTHIPTEIDLMKPATDRGDKIQFDPTSQVIHAYNTGGWVLSAADEAEGKPFGGSVLLFDSSKTEMWSSAAVRKD